MCLCGGLPAGFGCQELCDPLNPEELTVQHSAGMWAALQTLWGIKQKFIYPISRQNVRIKLGMLRQSFSREMLRRMLLK